MERLLSLGRGRSPSLQIQQRQRQQQQLQQQQQQQCSRRPSISMNAGSPSSQCESYEQVLCKAYCVVYDPEPVAGASAAQWRVRGDGWSQVNLLFDIADESSRIVGWTLSNYDIVLNCNVDSFTDYTTVSPDFHIVTPDRRLPSLRFGLGFYEGDDSFAEAAEFFKQTQRVIHQSHLATMMHAEALGEELQLRHNSVSEFLGTSRGSSGILDLLQLRQTVPGDADSGGRGSLQVPGANDSHRSGGKRVGAASPSGSGRQESIGSSSSSPLVASPSSGSPASLSMASGTHKIQVCFLKVSLPGCLPGSHLTLRVPVEHTLHQVKQLVLEKIGRKNGQKFPVNLFVLRLRPLAGQQPQPRVEPACEDSRRLQRQSARAFESRTLRDVFAGRLDRATAKLPVQLDLAEATPGCWGEHLRSLVDAVRLSVELAVDDRGRVSLELSFPSPYHQRGSALMRSLYDKDGKIPLGPMPILPAKSSRSYAGVLADGRAAAGGAGSGGGLIATASDKADGGSNSSSAGNSGGGPPGGVSGSAGASPSSSKEGPSSSAPAPSSGAAPESALETPAGSQNISRAYSVNHVGHVSYNVATREYRGIPQDWEHALLRQFGIEPTQLERVAVPGYPERIPAVLVQLREFLLEHPGFKGAEAFFSGGPEIEAQLQRAKAQVDRGAFRGGDQVEDVRLLGGLVKLWLQELPTHLLDLVPEPVILSTETAEQAAAAVRDLREPYRTLMVWLADLGLQALGKQGQQNYRTFANVVSPSLHHRCCPLPKPRVSASSEASSPSSSGADRQPQHNQHQQHSQQQPSASGPNPQAPQQQQPSPAVAPPQLPKPGSKPDMEMLRFSQRLAEFVGLVMQARAGGLLLPRSKEDERKLQPNPSQPQQQGAVRRQAGGVDALVRKFSSLDRP